MIKKIFSIIFISLFIVMLIPANSKADSTEFINMYEDYDTYKDLEEFTEILDNNTDIKDMVDEGNIYTLSSDNADMDDYNVENYDEPFNITNWNFTNVFNCEFNWATTGNTQYQYSLNDIFFFAEDIMSSEDFSVNYYFNISAWNISTDYYITSWDYSPIFAIQKDASNENSAEISTHAYNYRIYNGTSGEYFYYGLIMNPEHSPYQNPDNYYTFQSAFSNFAYEDTDYYVEHFDNKVISMVIQAFDDFTSQYYHWTINITTHVFTEEDTMFDLYLIDGEFIKDYNCSTQLEYNTDNNIISITVFGRMWEEMKMSLNNFLGNGFYITEIKPNPNDNYYGEEYYNNRIQNVYIFNDDVTLLWEEQAITNDRYAINNVPEYLIYVNIEKSSKTEVSGNIGITFPNWVNIGNVMLFSIVTISFIGIIFIIDKFNLFTRGR